jgi:hypothetical protein
LTTSKSLPFQPAPRPQPRVSPEQSRELAEATRDLGFGRTTTAPAAEDPAPAVADPAPARIRAPEPARTPTEKPASPAAVPAPAERPVAAAQAPKRGPALKFDVPDEVWTALRREALNRRVTVKYLVLEALAEKGYEVDLSAVPEDGRRLR